MSISNLASGASNLAALRRLDADVSQAQALIDAKEVRFLVDLYYEIQKVRIGYQGQVRSMDDEPVMTLDFFFDQMNTVEGQIRSVLDKWTKNQELGQWARSVVGIGPVISAGLIAYIDFDKATTAGKIWRFAGLDPTVTWEKGQKRPWNAQLKTLCWKIGESFVKVSGKEDAFYGQVYAERKKLETLKNERGDFREQAEAILAKKKFDKTTDAYKAYSQGKLPPAHIHARAKRYAVKLFLAHFFEIGYKIHHGETPPLPYPIAVQKHSVDHYIPPTAGVK